MTVDQFLASRGFPLTPEHKKGNCGYITPQQRAQFTKKLKEYPHLQKIAEIGFNGGHSAEHFFTHCNHLKFFAAFDLNAYPYTRHAVEYFHQKHPHRFLFVPGDSLVTVPEIHQKAPNLKFDLIYIDGCHSFEWVLNDILNVGKLAHEQTLLWIDDLHIPGVAAAVKFCETVGFIQIEKTFSSNDPTFGKRLWAQAKIIL